MRGDERLTLLPIDPCRSTPLLHPLASLCRLTSRQDGDSAEAAQRVHIDPIPCAEHFGEEGQWFMWNDFVLTPVTEEQARTAHPPKPVSVPSLLSSPITAATRRHRGCSPPPSITTHAIHHHSLLAIHRRPSLPASPSLASLSTCPQVLPLHSTWKRPCVVLYTRSDLSERLDTLPLQPRETVSVAASLSYDFSLEEPRQPSTELSFQPLATSELPLRAGQVALGGWLGARRGGGVAWVGGVGGV